MIDRTAKSVAEGLAEQARVHERVRHPAGGFVLFEFEGGESVLTRFARQVGERAEQPALRTNAGAVQETIRYRDLGAWANEIAHAILERLGDESSAVALSFSNGMKATTAILAVLKAGKFFVPLETSAPPERTAATLADCGARLLLTDEMDGDAARVAAASGVAVAAFDVTEGSSRAPDVSMNDDTLFCIGYTSGTTGAPKGVVLDHASMRHRIATMHNRSGLSPHDRVALVRSSFFLSNIATIFSTLLAGGVVEFFNLMAGGQAGLRRWIGEAGITVFPPGPTLFRQFSAELPDGDNYPALRLVRLGGDRALVEDARLFQRKFGPHCLLRTSYGISEATSVCDLFIDRSTRLEGTVMPAGYPTPGVEALICDADGREVAAGEEGEIVVRSRYLARGYWGQSELTAQRFLSDEWDDGLSAPQARKFRFYRTGDLGKFLPNGMLLVGGRIDKQVKVRGYRVEPTEVEAALLHHPAVANAAVLARAGKDGQNRLVAYVVCKGERPALEELRRCVGERVPGYMTPQHFVFVEAIPLTHNGKVDWRSLPEPAAERPQLATPYVAPRTPIERMVAEVWQETLEIDRVGIDDAFLDLGGHSLHAARIVARLQGLFPVDLPATGLLQFSTAAAMATYIVRALLGQLDPSEAAALLEGGSTK